MIRFVGLAALLTSCAVPASYGPYYRPTYAGVGEHAGIVPAGKSPAPPNRLWIVPGDRRCRFTLWADADDANLVSSWRVEWRRDRGPCMVSDAPLFIEDPDTGRRISIPRLRMVADPKLGAPRLDSRQQVDLASLIPGFGAAPPSERRYTLSLELEMPARRERARARIAALIAFFVCLPVGFYVGITLIGHARFIPYVSTAIDRVILAGAVLGIPTLAAYATYRFALRRHGRHSPST